MRCKRCSLRQGLQSLREVIPGGVRLFDEGHADRAQEYYQQAFDLLERLGVAIRSMLCSTGV